MASNIRLPLYGGVDLFSTPHSPDLGDEKRNGAGYYLRSRAALRCRQRAQSAYAPSCIETALRVHSRRASWWGERAYILTAERSAQDRDVTVPTRGADGPSVAGVSFDFPAVLSETFHNDVDLAVSGDSRRLLGGWWLPLTSPR